MCDFTFFLIASSSSSGANVGSPKPEKRQANSPLPPPPSVSPDITVVSHVPKNLDDMYAKVHKNKKKSETGSGDNVETDKTAADFIATSADEKKQEHNYETLRKCSDSGYEKIKPNTSEPGYASINGPDSIISDPGYEVLRQNAQSQQDDPNYEELHHNSGNSDCGYTRIGESNKLNCYATVNKPANSSSSFESDGKENNCEEPNYESMPSETASEHNYAALKSNGSESDPNYESVKHLEDDPPYERLHDDDSTKSTHSGYEKVEPKTNEQEKTEPPYERLSNDLDAKANNESPGYETIKSHSDAEIDDDGIVQV